MKADQADKGSKRTEPPTYPEVSTNGGEKDSSIATHPLFLDARRLLDALPVIDDLDLRDDEVRLVAALRAQRRCAEEAVERLVALLDELDPDPDLEPSLGYEPRDGIVDAEGEDDNGIGDEGGLQEQVEGEPSLGATSSVDQQRAWKGHPLFGPYSAVEDDLEREHDGREPDEDGEPQGEEVGVINSLPTPEDDNGIGDGGGLDEQFSGAFMLRKGFTGEGNRAAKLLLARATRCNGRRR